MIYTVTCNPSLDYWMEAAPLHIGEVNRAAATSLYPGGKGLNVSMVLHNFRMETTALGFVAGFVGDEIVHQVTASGCPCEMTVLRDGCSRLNVKLRDHAQTTEINAAGPTITPEALEEMRQRLLALEDGDVLVLAGSLPAGAPASLYSDWMHLLQEKKIHIVVDVGGDALYSTLAFHPFLIKPNAAELGDLFHVEIHTPADAAKYGTQLLQSGAENVLVSLGGDGAVLCAQDGQILFQSAATGHVVNDVGSGDSMVAGFLAGWMQTQSYAGALQWGTAAGAATAFSGGLATMEDMQTLLTTLEEPVPFRL